MTARPLALWSREAALGMLFAPVRPRAAGSTCSRPSANMYRHTTILGGLFRPLSRGAATVSGGCRRCGPPRGYSPCLGGCEGGHSEPGGPVGPPPSEHAVERQAGEREQAGRGADGAQGAVAFEGTAVHPAAEAALGVGQRGEDCERDC